MCASVISKLALKIESEIKELCSHKYNSILWDTIEAVKHFYKGIQLDLAQRTFWKMDNHATADKLKTTDWFPIENGILRASESSFIFLMYFLGPYRR